MATDTPSSERTDAELLDAVRAGDRAAFGVLWGRHSEAGRRVARTITHKFDADDLVSEAYLKILAAINSGKGPVGPFRPYLFVTIRNLAVSWSRQHREDNLDDDVADPRATDATVLAALDAGLTVRAFRSLPYRWQEVLWFTEVESWTPAQVADRLQMTPNGVAALAYRAREGFRQAWIQAHIDTSTAGSAHKWVLEHVGKSARGGLSRRQQTRFDDHLAGCPACTVVTAEAVDTSNRFTSLLLPSAVGVLGAAGLGEFLHHGAGDAAGSTAATQRPATAGASRRRAVVLVPVAVLTVALIGAGIGHAIIRPVTGTAFRPARTVTPVAPTAQAGHAATSHSAPAVSPPVRQHAPATPEPAQRPPITTSPSSPPAGPGAGAVAGQTSIPPTITGIDTGHGVLLPVISGRARPGADVAVTIGSTTDTVTSTTDGVWVTAPVTVPAGSYQVSATADGDTTAPMTTTITAPTLSASTTAGTTTLSIRGAADTVYVVRFGSQNMQTRTGHDGNGHTQFSADNDADTITVNAQGGTRTGPDVTIELP